MKEDLSPITKCSICESEVDPGEGGTSGYLGMIPVTFCVWCYAGIRDLAYQTCSRCIEEEEAI